jgi:hypothetical protein
VQGFDEVVASDIHSFVQRNPVSLNKTIVEGGRPVKTQVRLCYSSANLSPIKEKAKMSPLWKR